MIGATVNVDPAQDLQKVEELRSGDDLDAYTAGLTEEERAGVDAADRAIVLAILLHRLRTNRGLSQAAAAKHAGMQQQAVSRFERPYGSIRLDTLFDYAEALGYAVDLKIIDPDNGDVTACLGVPPQR